MKNLYKALGISPITLQPTEFVNLKAYQEHLIKTHLVLVEYLEARFLSRFCNNRLLPGDLASVGYEALLNAAMSFKCYGEAFLPYAYTTIRNAMQKEIRMLFPVDLKESYKSKEGFNYGEVFCYSAYDTYETQHYNSWEYEEQQLSECVDDFVEHLSSEDKYLIKAYYGFDDKPLTLQQLGDQANVSFQAIAKKKNRIQNQLKACINADYGYSMCA